MSSSPYLWPQKPIKTRELQKADDLRSIIISEALSKDLCSPPVCLETFEKENYITNILVEESQFFSPLPQSLESLDKFEGLVDDIAKVKPNDKLYENIEGFLDNEGLFIISPSPIISRAQLKPSIGFKRIQPLCSIEEKVENNATIRESDFSDLAIPSFLAKRTYSSDPNLIKRNMLIEILPQLEKPKSYDNSLRSN